MSCAFSAWLPARHISNLPQAVMLRDVQEKDIWSKKDQHPDAADRSGPKSASAKAQRENGWRVFCAETLV